MAEAIAEHAPAKVNLALHITGQRADGYHLLESIVVFTEEGDRVFVEASDEDRFTISGPFSDGLDAGQDNLVTRARDHLRALVGSTAAVAIHLEKNLPVASGIGGGSSDAAATLRALCRLWLISPSGEALSALALQLGADVPMCLEARSLIARGIGEKVVPVSMPDLPLVLVNPGVAVSTPSAFRALARKDNPILPSLPDGLDGPGLVTWLSNSSRNDLEAPARLLAPEVAEVIGALGHTGSSLSRMSGSGATCFGIFPSFEEACAAATKLAAAHPSWYVRATRTIQERHHGKHR